MWYREDVGISFYEPLTACVYELIICPTDSGLYLIIMFCKKITVFVRGLS